MRQQVYIITKPPICTVQSETELNALLAAATAYLKSEFKDYQFFGENREEGGFLETEGMSPTGFALAAMLAQGFIAGYRAAQPKG